MKQHRHWSPQARALVTFVATITLAIVAAVAGLIPDDASQSVEALTQFTRLPSQLQQLFHMASSN